MVWQPFTEKERELFNSKRVDKKGKLGKLGKLEMIEFKKFKDVGETFNYLGVKIIVKRYYFNFIGVRDAEIIIPTLKGDYRTDRGIIESISFEYSELPILKAENPE